MLTHVVVEALGNDYLAFCAADLFADQAGPTFSDPGDSSVLGLSLARAMTTRGVERRMVGSRVRGT